MTQFPEDKHPPFCWSSNWLLVSNILTNRFAFFFIYMNFQKGLLPVFHLGLWSTVEEKAALPLGDLSLITSQASHNLKKQFSFTSCTNILPFIEAGSEYILTEVLFILYSGFNIKDVDKFFEVCSLPINPVLAGHLGRSVQRIIFLCETSHRLTIPDLNCFFFVFF